MCELSQMVLMHETKKKEMAIDGSLQFDMNYKKSVSLLMKYLDYIVS